MARPTIWPQNHTSGPTVIKHIRRLSAIEGLPTSQDVSILLLGGGEPLHILRTIYDADAADRSEGQRLVKRELDFTCVNQDPAVFARTILTLSLLLQDFNHSLIEAQYFANYLTAKEVENVVERAEQLLRLSASPAAWNQSNLSFIRFGSDSTLKEIRAAWSAYTTCVVPTYRYPSQLPGSPVSRNKPSSVAPHPNPLLLYSCTADRRFCSLPPDQLRQRDLLAPLIKASWATALRKRVSQPESHLTVRFLAGDPLDVCDLLRYCRLSDVLETGRSTKLAPGTRNPVKLRASEYSAFSPARAPLVFDIIDTFDLADEFGAVNVLTSAVPLLSEASSARLQLYTEHSASLNQLFWGNASVFVSLLGVSFAGNYCHASLRKPDQVISLRRPSKGPLCVSVDALAPMLVQVCGNMLTNGCGIMETVPGSQALPQRCFYTPASFVRLLCLTRTKLIVDWDALIGKVLFGFLRTFPERKNNFHELLSQLYLHGLYRERMRFFGLIRSPFEIATGDRPCLTLPAIVCLLLPIPRQITQTISRISQQDPSLRLVFVCEFNSKDGDSDGAIHSDIQIDYHPDYDSANPRPEGDWPYFLVSFYVPAQSLFVSPKTTRISFSLRLTSEVVQAMGLPSERTGTLFKLYTQQLTDPSEARIRVVEERPDCRGERTRLDATIESMKSRHTPKKFCRSTSVSSQEFVPSSRARSSTTGSQSSTSAPSPPPPSETPKKPHHSTKVSDKKPVDPPTEKAPTADSKSLAQGCGPLVKALNLKEPNHPNTPIQQSICTPKPRSSTAVSYSPVASGSSCPYRPFTYAQATIYEPPPPPPRVRRMLVLTRSHKKTSA